jgi:hypothetical protein
LILWPIQYLVTLTYKSMTCPQWSETQQRFVYLWFSVALQLTYTPVYTFCVEHGSISLNVTGNDAAIPSGGNENLQPSQLPNIRDFFVISWQFQLKTTERLHLLSSPWLSGIGHIYVDLWLGKSGSLISYPGPIIYVAKAKACTLTSRW